MAYRKPDVQNLGDVASGIQIILIKNGTQIEFVNGVRDLNPAYDLDE